MIIDVYAMDSVVNRTRLLRGHGTAEDEELRLAMTNVFVSSANERVIDGARRILVNEFEGDELRQHLALEAIVPHMPIRTIAVKTRISGGAGGAGARSGVPAIGRATTPEPCGPRWDVPEFRCERLDGTLSPQAASTSRAAANRAVLATLVCKRQSSGDR